MPSTQDELGGLNSNQWRDLYDCASRLEKTLMAGAGSVDLLRFLPPPEAPHRRAVLHELIKTELEARYRRRQGCLLEEFLRRYPELGGVNELPASLLYEEFRVRKTFGDHPVLDDYQARFPLQFEQFRRLVRLNPPTEPSSAALPPTAYHTISPPQPNTSAPLAETLTSPPPLPPPSPTPRPSASQSTREQQLLLPGGEGYQLLERIGKGQFGEVHRALAPGGVSVAVKRIFRSLDDESSQRELKALERVRELRHPYLLQTHNFYPLQDHLVIVMELADGSLHERFNECRKCEQPGSGEQPGIPVDELLRYFGEAAEALDYLREQKLSHRDIKPQNLLHLKGHAKVADFGIARSQENSVDQTMHVGGTPAYMPPEMWRGEISVHSDQYSLAVTWYEMRTGRRIFSGKTQLEIAQQHMSATPDTSAVPELEQKVLQRALAKEPNQRYPACVAFVQALQEATAPPKPPVPGSSWTATVVVASLCFALTALLIALGVALWRGQAGPPTTSGGTSPPPAVSWLPKGWEPEDATDLISDRLEHHYYHRLVRNVGGQKVVMVVVPQKDSTDPRTFYIMENKVWNDLYAVFVPDPASKRLLQKYHDYPGCDQLVRLVQDDWRKGGYAPKFNGNSTKPPFFGVDGPVKGRMPVFRVTVTEAHCFAEWEQIGGRLPTRQQWRKAAGFGEDTRPGPYDGKPDDLTDLAVNQRDGPWPVDRGMRDLSLHSCRQMASNGQEWTRDLDDNSAVIPLNNVNGIPDVWVVGRSYLASKPLTFKEALDGPQTCSCKAAPFDVTFRVVLER